ncbi:protein TAPETUM DETERMINANT 1-like [Typha angustifolia]|uniref:protein TAPETUM DETERMINANT 1-like n=1 Tax=Typha angustifolia TaxID=59011 RepID=UPI003C2E195F
MARRAFLTLFFAAILACCIPEGEGGACMATDITVTQSRTGRVVEGKPEYVVSVRNKCRCAQSKVVLRCYGLSSVEAVDPRAIRPVDEERCVLGNGRPISKGTPVRFKYAWTTPQDFPLVSSLIHC